jgi:hypothetical protein
MEFTENELRIEKTKSDEVEDRDLNTDSANLGKVSKLRGIVAHRGALNCDHCVFMESHKDGCKVFADSNAYNFNPKAKKVSRLLGQAE